MTDDPDVLTTLVIDDHVVQVRVDHSGAPSSMVVNIEVDYARSWSFDEPGWQAIALGVVDGNVYWWSARHLVAVPLDDQDDPVTVSADEDIRFAFAVPDGWLLVCETSVRLIEGEAEVSRFELGEVVMAARWEASRLAVRDAGGDKITLTIADGRLTI